MNLEELAELYPILGFDPNSIPIINPPVLEKLPTKLVLCFFKDVIEKVALECKAEIIHTLRSESGLFPIYQIDFQGEKLAFMQPGVGSALSSGLMDEAIGAGARNIIACGGCGVLDKEIAVGKILLPSEAYREEGASYHYLPPSATVEIEPKILGLLERMLEAHKIDYLKTKVWTTDAFYRETANKAAKYKAKGVLAIDMELSALAAVAKHRGINFGQYLYAGDTVVPEGWDHRAWIGMTDVREMLFWLSAETCLQMEKEF